MKNKKGRKGVTPLSFDTNIKGLPKNAIQRKNKKGVKYYITNKGKRITRETYLKVKEAVRETKARPKERKRAKTIELPATLHRSFLSLLKDYLFRQHYTVEITDINKRYSANGSFDLFSSLKDMYNSEIKNKETPEDTPEESNDLMYFPYIDFVNKIISFNLSEILEYNHKAKTELQLKTQYLKKYF